MFNISIFSSASCVETMSKRMQQGTGEERIVAKSKPMLNLVSQTAASSSAASSSSASNLPVTLRAPSQQGSNLIANAGKLAAGGSNQNDAASSSQVWLSDAQTNDSARKLAAAGTNQDLSFQECARKLAAENSEIIVDDDLEWQNNHQKSLAYVPHLEKVHSSFATTTQTQSKRQNGRLRCEYFDMENVYVCHLKCRSSSWRIYFLPKISHNEP